MGLYVGITDRDWFDRLSQAAPDEVNFWKPGASGGFGTLQPGELFLFKLHAPQNFIVGGGHFVTFSRLPVSLAWLAFGEKNGVGSLEEFHRRIRKYRQGDPGPDPVIGNIVLTQPFWLAQEQWVPVPSDWPTNTVQGKTYDHGDPRAQSLLAQIQERLGQSRPALAVHEPQARYRTAEVDLRLGQGAFRVVVTDAYGRHCAITGESTLPVLEAAHIKPYSQNGPHSVDNGLLLRSDMHILFDRGFLTVTPDLRLEVSSQIREQYANGLRYYERQGQKLLSTPRSKLDRPSPEFLAWHNEHVFVA